MINETDVIIESGETIVSFLIVFASNLMFDHCQHPFGDCNCMLKWPIDASSKDQKKLLPESFKLA